MKAEQIYKKVIQSKCMAIKRLYKCLIAEMWLSRHKQIFYTDTCSANWRNGEMGVLFYFSVCTDYYRISLL